MIIGIPKEVFLGERRVSLVPNSVGQLVKSGLDVIVQSKAGNESMISDDEYRDIRPRLWLLNPCQNTCL